MKKIPPEERFWAKVVRTESCWEWSGALKDNGYGVFGVGRDEGNRYAHRYAWELTHGPIPAGMQVCHTCDNRKCARPDHLFLGTPAENQHDMVTKGRSLVGERHHRARLDESQVRDICRLWSEGATQADIAERFGVQKNTISMIVRGKRWRHLLPDGFHEPAPNRWAVR